MRTDSATSVSQLYFRFFLFPNFCVDEIPAQAGRRLLSTAASNGGQSRGRMFAMGATASVAAAGLALMASRGTPVQAKKQEGPAGDMQYKNVIIGAGVAARSCLKTLNELDKSELPDGYDGKVRVCVCGVVRSLIVSSSRRFRILSVSWSLLRPSASFFPSAEWASKWSTHIHPEDNMRARLC